MKRTRKNITSDKSRVFKALCREEFKAFLRKAFLELNPQEDFHDNFHLDIIAKHLHRVLEGREKRLAICQPPRSLKSFTASVAFVAFALGIDPTLKFICVSYGQELADKFGLETMKLMNTPWYKRLFKTRINKKQCSKSHFETTQGGGRFATSVDGALTGIGADVIIIDDPIKPDEAISDLQRNKVNNWYGSTLISRLNNKKKGVIITVMQRVHENDLVGFLEENCADLKCLKFPAIAMESEKWILSNGSKYTRRKGSVLEPEREPKKILLEIKKTMGSYHFAGQYQQDPIPQEGGHFKKNYFKYYSKSQLPKADQIILSLDSASKAGETNDYSVCTVWLVKNDRPKQYYLLDVFRKKLEYPKLRSQIMDIYKKYNNEYECPCVLLVEDKSSGTPLFQDLKQNNIIIKEFKPQFDKETRVISVTPIFEQGLVHLPERASWLEEYEKELLKFPKTRYDDQVDSTSQMLLWVHPKRLSAEKNRSRCYIIKGPPLGNPYGNLLSSSYSNRVTGTIGLCS